MKLKKEIYEIHKRLNDVKGTERKLLVFSSADLEINEINKKENEYILKSFTSLNWIYEDEFLLSKSDDKISFSKFKYLCFGKKTSELREVENSWRAILDESANNDKYIYVAYYIGNSGEIIVSEVGELTKSQFNNIK